MTKHAGQSTFVALKPRHLRNLDVGRYARALVAYQPVDEVALA